MVEIKVQMRVRCPITSGMLYADVEEKCMSCEYFGGITDSEAYAVMGCKYVMPLDRKRELYHLAKKMRNLE